MQHILSPAPYTEAQAIADMQACARVTGREWFVVWTGAYFVGDADDLATYYAGATIHARSHCSGCGDVMTTDPRSDTCAACAEWSGEHADEAIRATPILYINDLPQIAA